MSESVFPFKKVVMVILIAWMLSLVTTLVFIYIVVPNTFRSTWHEVTRLSGTFQEFDSKDTTSFYIPSDHWRLHWTVDAGLDPLPEDVEFRLFLYSTHYYPSLVWLTFADFQGSVAENLWYGQEDGTESITGSGWFSFRVRGARLDWDIIVEAYY